MSQLSPVIPPGMVEMYAFPVPLNENIAFAVGLGTGLGIMLIFWIVWKKCLISPVKTSFLVSKWDRRQSQHR